MLVGSREQRVGLLDSQPNVPLPQWPCSTSLNTLCHLKHALPPGLEILIFLASQFQLNKHYQRLCKGAMLDMARGLKNLGSCHPSLLTACLCSDEFLQLYVVQTTAVQLNLQHRRYEESEGCPRERTHGMDFTQEARSSLEKGLFPD